MDIIRRSEVKLSDFSFKKALGCGYFSQVIKAVHISSGTSVAIKGVKLTDLDPKTVEDCIKEVLLLQYLNHKNVIHYIASFTANTCLFIVLELADRSDLLKVISYFMECEMLMSEKTIWKFFFQVAAGLDHIHSRRIIHRDIKPANIFITPDQTVKIGDLGLSRYVSERTLEAYSLLGSPFYMSPERLLQRGYSFSSDIWSLGSLLYEMAALQPPYFTGNKSIVYLIKKIECGIYLPIPCPEYSFELKQLVNQCLQTNPNKRPNSRQVYYISKRMHDAFN